MKKQEIYIASSGIVTPLGTGTKENFEALCEGKSGISLIDNKSFYPSAFYASVIENDSINELFSEFGDNENYTKFEKMAILAVIDSNKDLKLDLSNDKTAFCLSTTKGNIELLNKEVSPSIDRERLNLWKTADIIKNYFNNPNVAYCISNACISGLSALIFAYGLLCNSDLENVVVVGADLVTKFVASGFFSFQAISSNPCKPFDLGRDGITLGEAAASIILTKNKEVNSGVLMTGMGISNDANHISGPSRTGDGLFFAIDKAIVQAGLKPNDIDFISAHGTATVFNDEMESKAFKLAGLNNVPLNSLKGFYGHTLGAAGLLESAISVESLLQNHLIASKGFEEPGTTEELNIIRQSHPAKINRILKTASGFGGSNAAIIFEKL